MIARNGDFFSWNNAKISGLDKFKLEWDKFNLWALVMKNPESGADLVLDP